MKRKGFTLIELLVVIAIIALLMGILMPALARVRQLAYRMVCGTNLSGIGKSMMVYATDNEEEYPRAGGRASTWSSAGGITDWDSTGSESQAFGTAPGAAATITSSFYLLVKYADATPKLFNCKADSGVKEFKLSIYPATTAEELVDAWDFGDKPGLYCSYSYHLPYNLRAPIAGFPIGTASSPSSPVCADRNPYLDKNADVYIDGAAEGEEPSTWNSTDGIIYDPDKTGNAAAHQRDGQNVLFNDSHVEFAKKPNIGINNDNIWKFWPPGNIPPATAKDRELGVVPYSLTVGKFGPGAEEDAYLVNERQN